MNIPQLCLAQAVRNSKVRDMPSVSQPVATNMGALRCFWDSASNLDANHSQSLQVSAEPGLDATWLQHIQKKAQPTSGIWLTKGLDQSVIERLAEHNA